MQPVSVSEVEPVSIVEAKQHLKMDGIGADDALIMALIASAREVAERITGRDLVRRTWDYQIDGFPKGEIEIKKAPLVEITSIKYLDEQGVERTLAPSVYGVSADWTSPFIYLKHGQQWPSTLKQRHAVTIRLVSGYPGDGETPENIRANIPPAIQAAIKIMLRDMYDNRGGGTIAGQGINPVGRVNSTGYNLLAPFRRMRA
jgi:uncharacterized phiE125 gp8 family phage protein